MRKSNCRRTEKLRAESAQPPDKCGLSEAFRSSVNWRPPKNREDVDNSADDKFVMMIRHAERKPGLGLNNRFLAVNRDVYKGNPAELELATHQRFWDARLENIRPLSDGADFVKSGAVIWRQMGLSVELARTASLLGLRGIDQETADAAQMAMFSAFNTSAAIPDLETIAFALSTFVHSHEYFAHMHARGSFDLPYGEKTAFKLLKPHGLGFG